MKKLLILVHRYAGIVLSLLLGVTAVSATGLYLGFRRLSHR